MRVYIIFRIPGIILLLPIITFSKSAAYPGNALDASYSCVAGARMLSTSQLDAHQYYHWNSNTESYFLNGKYMGNAMIEMKIWDNDDQLDTDDVYSPPNYVLSQNYPNPFNPSTNISFGLSERSHVTIRIYDVLGKLLTTLVDDIKPAGSYNVQFFASNLPSGMYVLQMQAGNYQGLSKMMLIK